MRFRGWVTPFNHPQFKGFLPCNSIAGSKKYYRQILMFGKAAIVRGYISKYDQISQRYLHMLCKGVYSWENPWTVEARFWRWWKWSVAYCISCENVPDWFRRIRECTPSVHEFFQPFRSLSCTVNIPDWFGPILKCSSIGHRFSLCGVYESSSRIPKMRFIFKLFYLMHRIQLNECKILIISIAPLYIRNRSRTFATHSCFPSSPPSETRTRQFSNPFRLQTQLFWKSVAIAYNTLLASE